MVEVTASVPGPSLIGQIRSRVAAHMASAGLDIPLSLAACFLLLIKAVSWVSSGFLWNCWWTIFWFAPVCYLMLWAVVGPRASHRLGGFVLVPAVSAALLVLERTVGRTTLVPWWTTHVAMCVALFCIGYWLSSGASLRGFRQKFLILVVAAFLIQLIPTSPPQSLWQDCRKLRIGSDVEQVFRALENQYVSDVGGRRLVRDENPSAWAMHRKITFSIARPNSCDFAVLTFENGKLASFWLTPD